MTIANIKKVKKQKLTPKTKIFCKEYLKDFNATRSAIAAGYSKKTAYAIGNKLLKKVEVAEYMQKCMQKRADKVDLSAEMILSDLIEIKTICMLDNDNNAAIKALELLGKHLAMWTDKTKHDVSDKAADLIAQLQNIHKQKIV